MTLVPLQGINLKRDPSPNQLRPKLDKKRFSHLGPSQGVVNLPIFTYNRLVYIVIYIHTRPLTLNRIPVDAGYAGWFQADFYYKLV